MLVAHEPWGRGGNPSSSVAAFKIDIAGPRFWTAVKASWLPALKISRAAKRVWFWILSAALGIFSLTDSRYTPAAEMMKCHVRWTLALAGGGVDHPSLTGYRRAHALATYAHLPRRTLFIPIALARFGLSPSLLPGERAKQPPLKRYPSI